MKCHWCSAPLRFVAGKGWTHPDGELYVGRCMCLGSPHSSLREGCPTWRDEHCALAVPR